SPPPKAVPLRAATTGLLPLSSVSISCGRNGSFISALNSLMSAPAEKNFPLPVSTIALMPGSALAAAKASPRAARKDGPPALTGGLCIRITAISPSVSVSTMATVHLSSLVWLFWYGSSRHRSVGCRPRLGAGLRPRLLFRHQAYQEERPCCAD